jgi:hypothetical protein
MAKLKGSFELALKAKLAQRATGRQSEENVLMRNFKYFDADNDGAVSLHEWYKTIEKIGVLVPSLEDLRQLFLLYDTRGDGRLDYKEFAAYLFSSKPPPYFSLYSLRASVPHKSPVKDEQARYLCFSRRLLVWKSCCWD